ncbi:MAG: HRDC domain-containing protein [Myxococcales bacterium]|nr:HRDC domain-containing protein [Myxococcales bacterium]
MHVVDSETELRTVAASLAEAQTLYLDTEFDSTRDGKTLCLLQLSGGEQVHLIDTLRLSSLEPLRGVLADPARAWVLHAGSQDVELLALRFDLKAPPRVFDTQVAWALTSVEHSVSLSYLKFRLLDLRSGKSHQADDWKRRPLPAAQLAYAAADIEELPALHNALCDRLRERSRGELVFEASRELIWPVRDEPEPMSLESFRNAWQLDARSQAALRYLVDWYNNLSPRDQGFAPEAKTLLAIAGRLPGSLDDLARIKGVNRRFADHHGADLVKGTRSAAASADTAGFVPIDPPPYATEREILLDGWLSLARAQLSTDLCVAPELVFPGRLMRRLKARVVETGELASAGELFEGWRRQLLADAFAEFAAFAVRHGR